MTRSEPPPALVAEVLAALRAIYAGELAEVRIIKTRAGVQVLRTTKRGFQDAA